MLGRYGETAAPEFRKRQSLNSYYRLIDYLIFSRTLA